MDKTYKYIKMCKKAKEIQEKWKPEIGDFMLLDHRGTTGFSRETEKKVWEDEDSKWIRICNYTSKSLKDYVHISDETGTHAYKMSDILKMHHIWIPRQDQLQKIFWPNLDTLEQMQSVWIFVNSFRLQPKTHEQGILMAGIYQKYSKQWDQEKENWIEIKQ